MVAMLILNLQYCGYLNVIVQTQSQKMYSFVPRNKMNGSLGFMLDFHYDSLIFKQL